MATTNNSKFRQKMDHFWRVLFLDEHGRPKSAMFMYSFCLSLLFFAFYAMSYGFLIDILEQALPNASVLMKNIAQSVLPGLAGSIVCCALFFVFPDRRLVPVAYLWLAAYAVIALITMALLTGKDEFRIFLYFFAMIVPVGLISGGITSFLLFRRYNKQKMKDKAAC
jgi:hypothetical protein